MQVRTAISHPAVALGKGLPPNPLRAGTGPSRVDRRVLIAVLGLTIGPGLFLLDTALALARGWRTWSGLDLVFVVVASLWLSLIGLVPLVPRGRTGLRRQWAALVALGVAGCGAWLLAEVASGFWLRWVFPPFHLWPPMRSVRTFDPGPTGTLETFPGLVGPSRFSTNAAGVRGPEWPPRDAAYRILCIGGSTTECHYLDDRETWPDLLMQRLNQQHRDRPVWVGNAGYSGFSTVQHLEFVQRSELIDQIDCALFLIGVNDFQLDWFWERNELQPLWRHSNMLDLIRKAYHGWRVPSLHVEDAVGESYRERRMLRQYGRILNELPDLTPSLRDYQDRVRLMAQACRRKHVRPVFLTQPTLWHTNLSLQAEGLLWIGWRQTGCYLSVVKLREGMDLFNVALKDVCRELGVECIDLTSMDGNEAFFYDDCHFTEAGARAVVHLVAGSL